MARAATRDELTDTAADAAIDQACRILRLPTIRDRHGEVAAAAARQQASYKGFLVELLSIECDDREQRRKARLVREAAFPRPKRLEDFDYAANPNVPAALIATLAKGALGGRRAAVLPDRRLRHRQVPPADRAGHRRRRERLPGPVRHRRRAGQRAGRGRRRQDPVPHHRPLRPGRPALPGRARATSSWTGAAPSCCSRSSPNARNAPPSRSRPTPPSASGHPPSPTRGCAPPSSTGSPSTPTSSPPAPTPTGCAPPRPATSPPGP